MANRVDIDIRMALDAVNLADKLADLAGKAGTSASALQRIGNAAADNGSSMEATSQALAKSQKALDGSDALANSFERLGITTRDAWAAMWDVALTAAEFVAMAAGLNPMRVRPQSLTTLCPLISSARDRIQGVSPTAYGSPTFDEDDNPPVYGI
jgi:hypothetical protein